MKKRKEGEKNRREKNKKRVLALQLTLFLYGSFVLYFNFNIVSEQNLLFHC